MIHYYRYLFVTKKVLNYSELHFSEMTSYKIYTLSDIDEVKGSHTKVQTEFDDFKKVIDEKVDEEIRLVST